MPKFFVKKDSIKNDTIYITGEDVNHITNVLRLKVGNQILVCDKDSNITYRVELIEILKENIVCNILEKVQETTESSVYVTIFQGLPKADKMEYIIQKTTELGVKEIRPVSMKRCVVKLDDKNKKKKIDRWQKIVESAAKQSGRDMIPIMGDVISINDIKDMIDNFDLMLIAYEKEKLLTLKNVLSKLHFTNKDKNLKIGVIIGPEGGLEEQEVDMLKESGAIAITLGNRILRTETASIAILSNIIYEFEC